MTMINLFEMIGMVEITPSIYLGNAWDAKDYSKLSEHGITAILNVSYEVTNPIDEQAAKKFQFVRSPLFDFDVDNCDSSLYAAIFQLDSLIQKNHKVLVHCQQGISRSPLVVLSYLYARKLAGKLDLGYPSYHEHAVFTDGKAYDLYRYLQRKRNIVQLHPRRIAEFEALNWDFIKSTICQK